jgi:hypothetical protein
LLDDEANTRIAIIHPEKGRYLVAYRLHGSRCVVIVQAARSEADETDEHGKRRRGAEAQGIGDRSSLSADPSSAAQWGLRVQPVR